MSTPIAWGKKLSGPEKQEVLTICGRLMIDPYWLMACMAFETGETFSPSVESRSGSHARGLIQFLRTTAISLGTTTDAMAEMTFIEQMTYVEKYFKPYKGIHYSKFLGFLKAFNV